MTNIILIILISINFILTTININKAFKNIQKRKQKIKEVQNNLNIKKLALYQIMPIFTKYDLKSKMFAKFKQEDIEKLNQIVDNIQKENTQIYIFSVKLLENIDINNLRNFIHNIPTTIINYHKSSNTFPIAGTYDRKNNIKYKINSWQEKECLPIDGNIELLIKVETNKYNKLLSMGNETIKAFKSYLASCDCLGRKMICHMIKELAEDSNCFYSTRSILKLFGMGKSSYYHILKDNDYGKYKALKIEQGKKDIEKIKEVINVNKYPKGRRMIYMLLDKNNNHMSMNKIARLCHKFNITCRVRKHNKSRKVARDLLTRNCKENLVKRRFKLCKPGEITLTDISYLKCPFGTVYLSALKDSSSGIVKLLISKNNNLNLALDTLKGLPVINNSHNKMFHSDQGILYLNDTFQNKLKELGYIQSMSKRGNCWDNSSQESFFGHMKDEVDFTKCHNIDDVIKEIKDYEYYYNYKRPQWNRNKMTPIEFATYINNMSDAEYEKYYNSELEKYNIMIENATLKAINRAKNIGIYLFALVLLGCINIFNAFALNSKKNLGTVILNTITTVLLLLFGFLYIFSFIDQTGKYEPNSSVYISIATVGISMACALAGCIISYFFIDKEYVKEVD